MLVVGVRVVAAVGEETLLGLVGAAGGGVEAELVAVLALLLELGDVTADNNNDVWIRRERGSASRTWQVRQSWAEEGRRRDRADDRRWKLDREGRVAMMWEERPNGKENW